MTRYADLDSQRHINNASYLAYSAEGQISYLKKMGYDSESLLNNKTYLKPEMIYVSFFRQQFAQVNLRIETIPYRYNTKVLWDQKIYNDELNELSSHFQTISSLPESFLQNIETLTEPLPLTDITLENFSGNCRRSVSNYEVRHIDLDGYNQCSNSVLWRFNEEARWCFLKEANIPFHFLIEKDTAPFWINGIYNYHQDVQLGDSLQVYTWISKLDKVRMYIRQEMMKNGDQKVLSTEGEFLWISMGRLKPIRTPEFVKTALRPYAEQIL